MSNVTWDNDLSNLRMFFHKIEATQLSFCSLDDLLDQFLIPADLEQNVSSWTSLK